MVQLRFLVSRNAVTVSLPVYVMTKFPPLLSQDLDFTVAGSQSPISVAHGLGF